MDILQAIKERYSHKTGFAPDPVPREDLRRIMEAGLAAPSGCNMQTTSLIGLDDPEVVRAVGGLMAGERPQFASAPTAVCVLSQRIPGYDDQYFCVQDYSAAIENMLIAATALGYVACWVEGYVADHDEMRARMARALGVPEGYELVAYVPVGRPARPGRGPMKKPFGERAWFNRFGGEG